MNFCVVNRRVGRCHAPVLLAPVHNGVRRAFARRFPYSVYYVCDAPDTQRVIAILHTAMDVTRLDERLE